MGNPVLSGGAVNRGGGSEFVVEGGGVVVLDLVNIGSVVSVAPPVPSSKGFPDASGNGVPLPKSYLANIRSKLASFVVRSAPSLP